jgi:hypothetical protein
MIHRIMKRYIPIVFLGLGLCQTALGGPSPLYANYVVVTSPPVVDALSFYNAGQFEIETVTSINPTNVTISLLLNGFSELPFMTKDTLNWTNASSGLMLGVPGFQFDTGTSTSRHNASSFLNAGTVESVDEEAFPFTYSAFGSLTAAPVPALSQPIASQLLVFATNIVNTGAMAVGNYGLLSMVGNNVTNANASLAAGSVSTAGLITDPLDTTGLQGQEESIAVDGQYYYVPCPGVYDLFWGITNALTVDLGGFDPPNDIPNIGVSERGFFGGAGLIGFPINLDTAQYSVTAVFYGDGTGTNFWYNVIFVNTNFADANLSATAGFTKEGDPQDVLTATTDDPNAAEAIVQIAEPVFDVISGQIVSNGIYLMDDGAYLPSMVEADNASLPGNPGSPGGYSRPNAFSVTTETPFEWADVAAFTEENAIPYDPTLFFPFEEYSSQKVPFEISEYGAQIGRNPANLAGSFNSLVDSNTVDLDELGFLTVNLPDPTNDPARIQINAANLDLTQARLRAEGMVILNVSNLIGGGTVAEDWGEMNANIGVTNGALVISNIFPTTFERVRGNIYAWSATWQNTQTNNGFGNTNFPATNQWHFHVLIVDQNILGTFPSTVRNLNLTGKNSIVLQDTLNVINQVVFNTTNLTVNSSNFFSQNAANFTPANTPTLKNLFINTNGLLDAAGGLDIGFNVNQAQAAPPGRKYTVNTITNFGEMIAIAPLLQSGIFENDGQIIADNFGSILIEANSLGLGLALTNITNSLLAAGNVDLSAATIEASNSIIFAGLSEPGALTLDATTELSDFVSGIPTTNTNSVIINHWTVTGGFSLPVKPATGDLFGTEIHTIATGFEQSLHVWAGTDMGATPAGFVNNAVIGHLVLDRLSNSAVLHFSAAGTVNAMYVDFLELTNFAFSSYRTGLVIDPNFTIYFAGSNLDPEKLMEVYPGLKWVQNFAGPNSTQVVPYLNSSNVCLMNANLAQSFEISFFNGLPNFYNQPFVLNDPSDPTNIYPCPGDELMLHSFLVATPSQGGGRALNLLNISVNGEGSLTPELKTSEMALGNSYSLTAKPAKGWVFQSWTTIGLAGAVNANSPILAFNFITNTLITANFIPNPFGALQGVYNGLFSRTGAVNPGSSGAFTLKLAPGGSFSGRLLMGPSTYSFSSQFSGTGGALVLAKSGAHSLTLNLQLDMSGQTGQIIGQVVNGSAWDAPLEANIAPVWTTRNPSPFAGSYTMVLQWPGESGGDGYGVGAVNKLGVLTIAGTLADGAAFSASAPVSRDGQWPFYAYAAAGKDSILGWVSVGNGLTGTNVTWSKPSGKGPLYPAGFTNVFQLVGSPWDAPAKATSALTLADPVVFLNGGSLVESLTINVSLQNYLTYTAPNLSLSIKPSNGSFTGWFESAGSGRRQTVSGVVLQNTGSACGFFQGANESGTLLLQDQSPSQ